MPRSNVSLAVAAAALSLSFAAGCGARVYQPSRTAAFELDAATEINDDDVRKAFEARPQMPEKARVAYFSFDPSKADAIDASLRALPGVSGTYRIPALLATGQRRFDEPRPWDPPAPFSMKKVRLLAARAHCDLVVVYDYGNRVEATPNALIAFSVLLVPTLFTPFLDVHVTSYVDSYVMDTRNGYLYAHVDAMKEAREDRVTIYAAGGERIVLEQWPELLKETQAAVGRVLEAEREQR
jgi:hypothetical protein